MSAAFSTFSPAQPRGLSGLPAASEACGIPRVIHQTYFSPLGDPMPPELEENVAWIRRSNPGWEHRLYGDDEIRRFVAEHYGDEIGRAFERINAPYGAVKADLFRYLLLYRQGGVYLDIKSRPLRPLDEVVREDDSYLLSQWRNGPDEEFAGFGVHPELRHIAGGEFQQWHIVASAGHPFLKAVIERVLRNIDRYNPALHGTGQHGVLKLTGPIAYTLAIQPILGQHRHRMADGRDELGFLYSIYKGVDHRASLGAHYSWSREPIARISGSTRLLAGAINAGRTVRSLLRGALGPEPFAPAIGRGFRRLVRPARN